MITIQSPAKINLFLDIIARRLDGYHDLVSLFIPVTLYDRVTIQTGNKAGKGPVFTSSGPYAVRMGKESENLVLKAVRAIEKTKDIDVSRLDIHLEKNIPVGAGLGGGSSNAAATILALNKMFELDLIEEEMEQIASFLGSDCPFFIRSRASLVKGRGEILHPVDFKRQLHLVIIKPEVSISTGKAYSSLLPEDLGTKTNVSDVLEWVKGGADSLPELHNTFQTALDDEKVEITEACARLEEEGADFALMSGSGSACFGLFSSKEKALSARDALTGEYQAWYAENHVPGNQD